jgi:hypothetical protein
VVDSMLVYPRIGVLIFRRLRSRDGNGAEKKPRSLAVAARTAHRGSELAIAEQMPSRLSELRFRPWLYSLSEWGRGGGRGCALTLAAMLTRWYRMIP